MATETRIVLICDKCNAQDDEGIHTHTIALGRKVVDVELCRPCFVDTLEPLIKAGRRVPRQRA